MRATTRRTTARLRGAAGAATAVALLAAGCGSSHSSTSAQAPAAGTVAAATTEPATATSASATPAPAPAGPSNGTDLAALLPAASVLGTGFKVNPAVSADSHDANGASDIPELGAADCSKLLHSNWTEDAGSGEAMALSQYKDAQSAEVTEELDLFETPDRAGSLLINVAGLAAKCTGMTDPETQTRITATGKALSGVGDQAYRITLTSPAWKSGTTLEAVRVGDVVVSIFVLTVTAPDNGAGLAATAATAAVKKLHAA